MLGDIGLFDEKFSPAHYEDVDLSFRAQLRGHKCLYVSDAIAYHHGYSTLDLFSPTHLYLCSRNIGYVLIKNMPYKLLLKYFCSIVLYNIISFLGYVSKGGFISFIRGKLDILKNLGYVYRQRKMIQNKKIVSDAYIDSILTHYSLIHFIVDNYKKIFFHKNVIKCN